MRKFRNPGRTAAAALALVLPALALAQRGTQRATAPKAYFPAPNAWEHRTPEQVGLSAKAVQDAVAIAVAAESNSPRDLLEAHRGTFGREPFGEATGPFRSPRGGAAGVIVKNGYIVAEWGDPGRVDQTYSVTKSFVTTTVGLAFDRRMITSLDDPVYKYMPPVVALKGSLGAFPPLVTVPPNVAGAANVSADQPPVPKTVAYNSFDVLEPFETDHNRKITWLHMLQQTSEWQGTLWGKPDWADRPKGDIEQWKTRARPEPGTVYTYNDVRVNLMALASLMVWRRPLPQVLKELVMDPIGASNSWRWYGYDNSWVVLDGARAIGGRRRPLGRRPDHQLARHGALRVAHAAQGKLEREATDFRRLDQSLDHAGQGERRVRIRELLPEHRTQGAAQRA